MKIRPVPAEHQESFKHLLDAAKGIGFDNVACIGLGRYAPCIFLRSRYSAILSIKGTNHYDSSWARDDTKDKDAPFSEVLKHYKGTGGIRELWWVPGADAWKAEL